MNDFRIGRGMVFASLVLAACGLAACGAGTGLPVAGGAIDDVNVVASAAIERCASGEGLLTEIASVDNRHGPVTALALGATGGVAIGGEDGIVKFWNLATRELAWADRDADAMFQYGGAVASQSVVRALAFDATGALLACGDDAGLVVLRDAANGVLVDSVSAGAERDTAVALNDDASLVAVADRSFAGNIRVWKPFERDLGEPLPTALWGVTALAFVPSSDALLTAGHIYTYPTVELRGADEFEAPLAGWQIALPTGEGVTALAVASDASIAVAAGDGFVAVLDVRHLADAVAFAMAPDHDATSVALTPSGRFFATGGAEGTIRLFKTASAVEVARIDAPASTRIAIDATGDHLVAAGVDGVLRVFGCE